MRQGDPADFCFVIRFGLCDVLVLDEKKGSGPLTPGASKLVQQSQARTPTNASGSGDGVVDGKSASEGKADGGAVPTVKRSPAALLAKMRSAQMQVLTAVRMNTMRLVVTLPAGSIIGEVALVSGDNAKRNATVR